jgi:hypothetical protein
MYSIFSGFGVSSVRCRQDLSVFAACVLISFFVDAAGEL